MIVSRLRQLLSAKQRPAFLTGHSLGGALATVCSVGILFCGLPLSSDQVTVVTYTTEWNQLTGE